MWRSEASTWRLSQARWLRCSVLREWARPPCCASWRDSSRRLRESSWSGTAISVACRQQNAEGCGRARSAILCKAQSPMSCSSQRRSRTFWFSQHAARTRGHIPPWEPDELLEMLGLQDLANERLAELPRGLQQQVAVVAGIGSGPRLLLADEPTSQLPQEATIKVVRLLQHIAAEFGTTVVIVTHDPTVAQLFPRTVTIRDGRVGAEGHRGQEYAVVDSSGSIQLPPDVLDILPPNTRVRVIRGAHGVELRSHELDP